jgi:hypothetical protein
MSEACQTMSAWHATEERQTHDEFTVVGTVRHDIKLASRLLTRYALQEEWCETLHLLIADDAVECLHKAV